MYIYMHKFIYVSTCISAYIYIYVYAYSYMYLSLYVCILRSTPLCRLIAAAPHIESQPSASFVEFRMGLSEVARGIPIFLFVLPGCRGLRQLGQGARLLREGCGYPLKGAASAK